MHPPSAPAGSRVPVSLSDLAKEPFRLFFPLALLTGMSGVLLWPLHFLGVVALYPGAVHARLMAHGFFAGFMLGFLGTALPRMLGVRPFSAAQVFALAGGQAAMTLTLLSGRTASGDVLLLIWLGMFAALLAGRFATRTDLPPPGFVLVALAFLCLGAGTVLSLAVPAEEETVAWTRLQHLLSYQGFVLLPILGVGTFLFPRFLGLPNRQDFPEARTPAAGWVRQALAAAGTGAVVLISFGLEAWGWERAGVGLRMVAAAVYLLQALPLHRGAPAAGGEPGAGAGRGVSSALARWLKLALALIAAGFLAILVFPAQRVGLLHLTLVGGFALTTLVVATRVVFGHSGNQSLLAGRQRWLDIAVGVMLLAMLTRVSGDFKQSILVTHYSYGAVLWVIGALIWAWRVLPKVLIPDPDR